MIRSVQQSMPPLPRSLPPVAAPPDPQDSVAPSHSFEKTCAKLGAYAGMSAGSGTSLALHEVLGFTPLAVAGPITGILLGAAVGACVARNLHNSE